MNGSDDTAPGIGPDSIKDSTTSAFTDTSDYGGVVGVAMDGHVIYGPYNSDGELWECGETDACNGFYLDDGSYGYASTTYFPYTVGCWGPAPPYATQLGCSENSCAHAASLMVGSGLLLALFGALV